MNDSAALLTPVFIEIALTFGLLIWAGYVRVQAVRTRQVQARDVSLGQLNWPPQAMKLINAYHNQLELPVLFYVVVILILTQLGPLYPTILIALAWAFVILRIAHAAIHVTTNDMTRRFFLFTAGLIVLLLMWFIFMVRIYLGA